MPPSLFLGISYYSTFFNTYHISQFITNTFTITTPSLTPLGSSVSPLVALINHSCDPNAVVVFPRSQGPNGDEPRMKVVAIKPILPGQEVHYRSVRSVSVGQSAKHNLQRRS